MSKYIVIADPDVEDYCAVISSEIYTTKNEQGRVIYFDECFACSMTHDNAQWVADALNAKEAQQ